MNRRDLLLAAGAAGLAPRLANAQPAPGLRAAAREAWLYGLPLIEMAGTRARAFAGLNPGVNRFGHARRLAGPESRAVTAPNNDTLYSSAWLDLTQGPVTLTIPPTGDRYISVAAMNMFTDNDAVLGTRTTGRNGGRFTLVGPGQAGGGPDVVRIATPHAWLLARTLVDGEADLPAVHKVQAGLTLEGPTGQALSAAWPKVPGRQAPALDYFDGVAAMLKADPPPATDGAFFARVAPLGLTAAGQFDRSRFSGAQVAEIEAGVAEAKAALRSAGPIGAGAGRLVDGWTYPPNTLGFYNQAYAFRAAVALGGLAALPPAEAMYMHPEGDTGRMFTGAGPYRLHFPAGKLPPVDGFWSLTMYEGTPDGQFFLVENPARRYAIGDRTPGLTRNADGSLDIWIARDDPGGARTANWLPAPKTGPFTMSLRAYLPRQELIDGRWRAPKVQAVAR
ncbi:DUF1254 domain-containing protein [Phenylobacterium sp. VNQ135]|uniref:DUF1254 domain-containing protein n=1 Tax=Phenylobacterium sp. VNQ135 TaxID=3400922 RepID=UPI003C0236D2